MAKLTYQRELKFCAFRLPPELLTRIDDYAKREHKPKQAILWQAVAEYLERRGYPHLN